MRYIKERQLGLTHKLLRIFKPRFVYIMKRWKRLQLIKGYILKSLTHINLFFSFDGVATISEWTLIFGILCLTYLSLYPPTALVGDAGSMISPSLSLLCIWTGRIPDIQNDSISTLFSFYDCSTYFYSVALFNFFKWISGV